MSGEQGNGYDVAAGTYGGRYSFAGAGSVVTQDSGPCEIAVGVPARTVRTRFREDVIRRFLGSSRWEWDRATLVAHWRDLCELPGFFDRHCQTV